MAISDHCSESMSPFCLETADYDCYKVKERLKENWMCLNQSKQSFLVEVNKNHCHLACGYVMSSHLK